MSNGKLNLEQENALRPFLQGLRVHDLGAGDMRLSGLLVRLGAQQVVAIDKEPTRRVAPHGVVSINCYFENYPGPIETAFLSWPMNRFDVGLLSILHHTQTIIYLGQNTDGSACGFPQMWNLLATREVLAHVPDEANTLIVYGSRHTSRRYLPEEYCGIFQDRMWRYREIHAIQDKLPVAGLPSVLEPV